jgi:hypothetical protein
MRDNEFLFFFFLLSLTVHGRIITPNNDNDNDAKSVGSARKHAQQSTAEQSKAGQGRARQDRTDNAKDYYFHGEKNKSE